MDTRLQNQAKTSSVPSVSPVHTGLFQSRPFAEPEQEAAEASDFSHQPPNLQTQLEPASRFGHNFCRVQVQTNTPAAIQTQLINKQPEDQQDEEEANEVAEPLKTMAPPVGEPIEPESPEESIQMMPQWGRLTPAIQRQEQEEESIQMMPQLGLFAPVIQRQEQEDEPIQMMPQWGMLQRLPQEEDDLPMQMMPQWGVIQRQESEAEEEQPIQMKWLQAKLVVGAPGDKYEQEADSVAAQVMSMSVPAANPGLIQRQGEEEEQEPLVQRSPLADSITPLVQRLPEEQEEAIQAKSLQQQGVKGNAEAGSDVESQLNQSKGGGSPLPDEVRSFMEPRFGTDFSSVRVHTDSTAVQMNKDLRAQAFAHGSDIYYGAGKSPAQDSLTAHELTHVVQQTGAKKLQQKPLVSRQSNKETIQAKISPAPGAAIQRKQAPDSPQADSAFQAVVNKTKGIASKEKTHPPAKAKSAEAQAAAKPPANEVESKAQDKKVQEMNQQKPGQFNAEAFKAALRQKIAAVTPNTLEEADKFKESNKIDSVKGELSSKVTEEKKQASGPVEEKTKEPPNTSGITPKPVTPLPANQAGAKPGVVGAAGAAPKPKDASEVSLQEGSKSLDEQMASANVTDEQLQKSNEPEFQGALDAKKTAQADAAKAPQDYRQQEQGILASAQATAEATAQQHLQAMHGIHTQSLGQVAEQQVGAKGKDEQARAKVAGDINKIYDSTKSKVEETLSKLDGKVIQAFDTGAAEAKKAFEDYVGKRMDDYKSDRYSGFWGPGKWLVDKLLGMPSEVNAFYQEGRQLYINQMDGVINKIVAIISTGLTQAKAEIASGKQKIQSYVNQLPQDLKGVGQQAAADIESKFEELQQSVDDKQNELIDTLAQKYQENLQAVDARIEEMKAANKGLIQKAFDFVAGVIKTIIELTKMLLEVLARVAGVVGQILKDPIGFLSNLIQALKQGFLSFMNNIGKHLQQGLIGWLTGTMAEAGIQMPENLDIKGIFSLAMQLMGYTYEAIRTQAVKRLGEEKVSRMEQTVDIFKTLASEGVAGMWQFVQDKMGDLNALVIEPIKNFIIEKVITAGIEWILSLLTPASAFIKAAKAIYEIVKFFIERAQQIAELINAILDAIGAIASGAIDQAVKGVENALAKSLPVVISFLASLLGLGGIAGKIQAIFQKLRKPMEKAVNWVIDKGAKAFKKVGNKVKNSKFGKKAGELKDSAKEKYKAGKQWVEDKKEAGQNWVNDKKEAAEQWVEGKKKSLKDKLGFGKNKAKKNDNAGRERQADVMGNNPGKKKASPDERKEAAKNKFISLMNAKKSMSREEMNSVFVKLKTEFQLSNIKLEGNQLNPKIGFYASPATFLPLSGFVPKMVRLFQPNRYDISGQKPGVNTPSVQAGDYIKATYYDGPFPTPGQEVVTAFDTRFQGKRTTHNNGTNAVAKVKVAGGTTSLYAVQAINPSALPLQTQSKGNTYRRAGSVEAKSSVTRGTNRSGAGETVFGHFGADEERIKTGQRNTNYNGGHLIGDQIMDSHQTFNLYEDWNLVPQQRTFNSPVYTSTIENPVTKAINAGATIKYTVRVQYPDNTYQIQPSVLVNNLLPQTNSYRKEIEGAIQQNPGLDNPFNLTRRTPGFWQATAEVVPTGKTINSGNINIRQNVAFENNPVNVQPAVNYKPVAPEQVRYSLEIDQGAGAGLQAQSSPAPKNPLTYAGAIQVQATARQQTF